MVAPAFWRLNTDFLAGAPLRSGAFCRYFGYSVGAAVGRRHPVKGQPAPGVLFDGGSARTSITGLGQGYWSGHILEPADFSPALAQPQLSASGPLCKLALLQCRSAFIFH